MVSAKRDRDRWQDDEIAALTDRAYGAVLERGYRGSFLELELSLWQAIRSSARELVRPEAERAN